MSVNVNRSVSDQFYRYKMPRLIAKVEGKGNGIKTVIVNMVDVAKALNRPPTYPTKYFGCELGAQTQFDVKNDRYIVNGSHEANKLQDMLDGFIKKFVLCPECENPETDLHVNPKKQTIGNSCKACGYRGMLDTHHKLCTFILKNPLSSSETPPPPPPSEMSPPPRAVEEEEDDDWGEDTTEEAQRRRMDEISDHAKVLTLSDDLERTVEERVNILFDFVKKKKEEGIIDSSDKEIVAEAERLDVKAMGPLVLTEVLFNEKIREQIKKYRRHFLRFCHNNKKAQRYLLHGLECVVAMHQAQLLSKIPHILKEMYDADLLEEEVIISWSEKASKKYVSKELAKEIRVKAEPFIKWLKEAEEESSGGEDEEEDENIEAEAGGRGGAAWGRGEERAQAAWESRPHAQRLPRSRVGADAADGTAGERLGSSARRAGRRAGSRPGTAERASELRIRAAPAPPGAFRGLREVELRSSVREDKELSSRQQGPRCRLSNPGSGRTARSRLLAEDRGRGLPGTGRRRDRGRGLPGTGRRRDRGRGLPGTVR
ncbi:eukaryotic translation initiation factor 5 [Octodon degus]|uniref:Eukaryotic translation initiation factor 5 n=8 Tax=Euarchontoglires TaxID=314146 RepID=A0A6P3FEU4_OCTDE|nr:eukaryotic translation initiation factor 5 [Octodon degus]